MHISTPVDVTHEELTIWLNALFIGAGSWAEVSRVLRVSTVTLHKWRGDEERRWEWWWRDVMQSAVTHITTTLRTETLRARQHSERWNTARRRMRGMNATLERLPYDAFDAITPPPALTPTTAHARAFIVERLKGKGAVDVKRIHAAAAREGISRMALSRAVNRMNVVRRMRGNGEERVVTWEMIDDLE